VTEDQRKARLERALLQGGPTHTLGDVADRIKDNRAQFWGRDDGMIVTEYLQFPLMRMVNYWLVAGVLRDCLALQAEIDAQARADGCDFAVATGRRGWARAAPGWHLQSYTYVKPLAARPFWGVTP
jgi:hypothetical protein